MPGIFHQAGCCCAAKPCVDCADPLSGDPNSQPDAEATIDGSDNEDVLLFEGTWDWTTFFPGEDYCYWRWDKDPPHASAIDVNYCILSGKWYAWASMQTLIGAITFGGDDSLDCPDEALGYKEITGLVNCNKATGKLAGAFVLDCTDVRFPGVTLNVTLGG